MIEFVPMHAAGIIPTFLDVADPRPAAEQIHDSYAHGGGWIPLPGFRLVYHHALPELRYHGLPPQEEPVDPPFKLVAFGRLRDDTLYLFESAFVAIVQPDGSFEVARVD